MYQKYCSLLAQVWLSVTIIIHLSVLDDFIFEASHEECDVAKFNQLNGTAWILPGELSAGLYVCEYLSKRFIQITTVKGVTTIEGIETMDWNQPTLDWKLKNDWTNYQEK